MDGAVHAQQHVEGSPQVQTSLTCDQLLCLDGGILGEGGVSRGGGWGGGLGEGGLETVREGGGGSLGEGGAIGCFCGQIVIGMISRAGQWSFPAC